ncbi:unnamed protein product [Cunninghamella blakesleeana]
MGYEGSRPQEGGKINYGDLVKLKHVHTGRYIDTDGQNYQSGSGQKRVIASDDGATWRLLPIRGSGEELGYEVGYDDEVIFENVTTGEKLHSSPGVSSPISGQQEVSAGGGDDNDNWTIVAADDENEDGFWRGGENILIIHSASRAHLHSHDIQLNEDAYEVVGNQQKDENSVWIV